VKKVVFITDVRFWRCHTGAQQRINSLVQYMNRSGFTVTILFAAPLSDEGDDRSLIDSAGLKVLSLVDDNAWMPNDESAETVGDSDRPATTLESLQTAEFVPRVEEFLQSLDPDIVVVEYVTLAYLLPPKKSRRFVSVLDSHDLLASRCQQFQEQGHRHWIEISPEHQYEPDRCGRLRTSCR